MLDIRALGRVPKDYGNTADADKKKESTLARILRKHDDSLSTAQKNAITALRTTEVDQVMVEIRALGQLPKEPRKPKDENQRSESVLALRLRARLR